MNTAKSWQFAAAGALGVAAMMMTELASAHAGLVKSVPGSRASLSRAPAQLELCFNEEIELKFSTVQLLAPDGAAVPVGASGFGSSKRCLAASLPALHQVGVYTVKYKVLSQDGHVVEYGYTFALRPAAE